VCECPLPPRKAHNRAMDDIVRQAIAKWPHVPDCYGWLGLDARGQWYLRDEGTQARGDFRAARGVRLEHAKLIDFIHRNYEADARGCWFFQNGPQRVYVELEYAPFVLRRESDGFVTHTGLRVERPPQAILDEVGTLSLATEHGLGEIYGGDLDWVLDRLSIDDESIDEEDIAEMLDLPSHTQTNAVLALGRERLPVVRIDSEHLPEVFSFVRHPEPLEGERVSTGAPD